MRHFMNLWYDDWWSPKKGNYPFPCHSIESLTYDYSETKGMGNDKPSKFMVLVHFPNVKYRQIAHVQEYDIESLVGNIGGYIGLFLGYSLINFPRFVIAMFEIVRKKLVPSVKKIRSGALSPSSPNRSIVETGEGELKVDFESPFIIQSNGQDLQNTTNNVPTAMQTIDEAEPQTLMASGSSQSDKSFSLNSPIRKVRVTEWNNNMRKPQYM